ncbi:hypothetical protein O6H91_08G066700 [Diphasiastrum complanatum]|uniref:Uncharacterized protein n=1 Tax=Diphasiastrum complanatum TaxID=34168 RepID=A0ACC2CZG0_DIPCM|nr:hypothetical protein O6H91_08G066700 [Diphasiastrum complanatum]
MMVWCSRNFWSSVLFKEAAAQWRMVHREGLIKSGLGARGIWIARQKVDEVESEEGKLWFPRIELHKSRGQHILKNPSLVQAIVRKAEIKSSDTVLEIGPGTGNMTVELLKFAKKVVAVEVDPRMVKEVQRRTEGTPGADHLQIIQGDFLKAKLPPFDVCVANIPYQISSPLVFKLLQHKPRFRCAIIMFQKEFALRLMAKPGDSHFCRLAINAQLLADIEHLLKVGKGNFQPPPKVDSSVVRIQPRSIIPPINLREWDALIRACFSRKNKTLGAIFKQKNVILSLQRNSERTQDPQPVRSQMVDGYSFSFDNSDGEADHEGDDDKDVDSVLSHIEENSLFLIKETVQTVLQEGGYQNKRSSKMTQDDFIKLLSQLNNAGIHFAIAMQTNE